MMSFEKILRKGCQTSIAFFWGFPLFSDRLEINFFSLIMTWLPRICHPGRAVVSRAIQETNLTWRKKKSSDHGVIGKKIIAF